MRECFFGSHSVPPTHENVLGVLSLIVYSLLLVISIKYLAIVMRADNHGEGGILALTALLPPRESGPALRTPHADAARALRRGAALRRRHDHAGHHRARRGRGPGGRHARCSSPTSCRSPSSSSSASSPSSATAPHRVGRLFGPVMVVWFVAHRRRSASPRAARAPEVLRRRRSASRRRVLPRARPARLRRAGRGVPGGHRRRGALRRHGPLRQAADPPGLVRARAARAAAQLLRPGRAAARRNPARPRNPFFLLAPGWALLPLVALATAAAIIASQALISGAFSLTQQAMQLGYVAAPRHRPHLAPRDRPDLRAAGQLGADGRTHRPSSSASSSSTSLAAAYGIAVTLTMVITAILLHVVAIERWGWPPAAGLRRHRTLPDGRPRLLRRQRPQDRARRLAAAGHRRGCSSR